MTDPSIFNTRSLSDKRQKLGIDCDSEDRVCHNIYDNAYKRYFFETPLKNVCGMTVLTLLDDSSPINIIIIGEQHDKVEENEIGFGSLVNHLLLNCKETLDIFVEDHFAYRSNSSELFRVDKGDSFKNLYTSMKDDKCGKIRFHSTDLRSPGIMGLIFYLEDGFKNGTEPYIWLDHVANVVIGEYELCRKIYHSQMKKVKSRFVRAVHDSVESHIQTEIIPDMFAAAATAEWKEAISCMNHIVDWTMNMYTLLRASRNDFNSVNRLIYVGEHHRW
jgi:hypothetical protein